MNKQIKLLAIALLGLFTFTGCSDDPTYSGGGGGNGNPEILTPAPSVLILNQGNSYSPIPTSSLDQFTFADSSLVLGAFAKNNENLALGDNPQNGVVCGSKIYISIYKSNVIQVMDSKTLKSDKMIGITTPNYVVTDGKYVYATTNDGYVARIDTASLAVTEQISVGPNPVGMAISNGYLYVANSDGYNFSNNYANGKSVSKIKLATFKEESKIPVGLNPTKLATDSKKNIFVLCNGNYGDVPSMVQKIDKLDKVTDFAKANFMAVNDTIVYLANTSNIDYATGNFDASYSSVSSLSGKTINSNLLATQPYYPTSMKIDAARNILYFTSDLNALGYANRGYVFMYDLEGNFLKKLLVGVHPVDVIF